MEDKPPRFWMFFFFGIRKTGIDGIIGPYRKQFLRRSGTLLMKPAAVAVLPKTNAFAVWTAGPLALANIHWIGAAYIRG